MSPLSSLRVDPVAQRVLDELDERAANERSHSAQRSVDVRVEGTTTERARSRLELDQARQADAMLHARVARHDDDELVSHRLVADGTLSVSLYIAKHVFPISGQIVSRRICRPSEKRMVEDEKPPTCDVCAEVGGTMQLLPDRSQLDPPYAYQRMCGRCLDDLLSVYPRLHRWVLEREVGGAHVWRRGTVWVRRDRG